MLSMPNGPNTTRKFAPTRDLRFIDPAFTCEVLLTGTARALYEAAKPQFERLKGIRSLGLIAQIQDVAQHTRHQHLIGLMRIFNKLCQQSPRKGLPKDFLWSFWCRLCFAQTGHAALSYDSEKAVLLACHLDTIFKDKLRALLQPVITSLAPCTKCSRPGCGVKGNGVAEAPVWFDELVAKNRTHQLYLWVASLKLIQHPSLLDTLSGQRIISGNLLGFAQAEALKLMIAPGCKWDSVVRNLSRMDFIPRDLAFAGTIGIRFDVDSLISAADEKHPDWKLLASLSNYMSENIYESPELQLQSTLFQRALAALLIKGKVLLEELFGLDAENSLSDDDLRTLVAKTPAGKQVFDPTVRADWKVWPIKTFVDSKRTPSEVEKEVTGHAKGHLTRHVDAKVTCIKFRRANSLALAMRHRNLTDKPDAKAFVKLFRSLLLKQLPKIDADALANALYEGLVARECEHGLELVMERLTKLNLPADSLRPAAEVVNRRLSSETAADGEMSIRVGEFAYAFHGDPEEFRVNAMHAAISGDDTVRKNLGMTLEDAAGVLWWQLLLWQSLHFGLQPTKAFTKLLDEAQKALAANVLAGAPTAEGDLEAYTLLEALKHPADSVSFRIALPNLKLMKEDGQPENEYDVVSVILKEDKHVQVWVWGVTVEQNLTAKRNDDMAKIQKLKDLLGQRWGGDVTVRTCYVHKDGNDICCEIDGCQSRRTVT
jgi:hypothetical protein